MRIHRTFIVGNPSYSSRRLSKKLRIGRIRVGRDRIPINAGIINWGCSDFPQKIVPRFLLNSPESVRLAVDKISTFEVLKKVGIPVVDFTKDRAEALNWVKSGKTVYGRELTRASEGRGIKVYLATKPPGPGEQLPNYPLFTKFWKCDRELRVHVFRDNVIDFCEKRKRRDFKEEEGQLRYWIRSFSNGWIFARSEAKLHPKVAEGCIKAVKALGLDFGAVDVRVRTNGEFRILEINSAPGITATTIERYTEAFRKVI